jgi:hypothetical protein
MSHVEDAEKALVDASTQESATVCFDWNRFVQSGSLVRVIAAKLF